ncbi:membrane protein [Lentzea aerocolonigenes]|uniref:Membrane protein n=1 Tax=Lentzea aerocolonigenes TaxID=68170 RepID=A0A0F0H0X2_LENAE|nr:membrane protein [Lentzea aerocolonigenes]
MIAAGAAAGLAVSLSGHAEFGPLVGWDVATLVYLTWVWLLIWPMDAEETARHAVRNDPTRTVTEIVLLLAATASLVSVGFVLARAAQTTGASELLRVGLGVLSVVLSWMVVHTIFTLRYARLYYFDVDGGIDFNQPEPPDYGDFAYVAFSIGMTFQVSDTSLSTRDIRRTVLKHALLSYLFGTGVLATTINLVASISTTSG